MSPNVQQIFDLLPEPGTPERHQMVAALILELTGTTEPGPVRMNGKGSKVIGYFTVLYEPSGEQPPKLSPEREAEIGKRFANRRDSRNLDEFIDQL